MGKLLISTLTNNWLNLISAFQQLGPLQQHNYFYSTGIQWIVFQKKNNKNKFIAATVDL